MYVVESTKTWGGREVFALKRAQPLVDLEVFAALSRLVEPIKASFMKLYVCGGCPKKPQPSERCAAPGSCAAVAAFWGCLKILDDPRNPTR